MMEKSIEEIRPSPEYLPPPCRLYVLFQSLGDSNSLGGRRVKGHLHARETRFWQSGETRNDGKSLLNSPYHPMEVAVTVPNIQLNPGPGKGCRRENNPTP